MPKKPKSKTQWTAEELRGLRLRLIGHRAVLVTLIAKGLPDLRAGSFEDVWEQGGKHEAAHAAALLIREHSECVISTNMAIKHVDVLLEICASKAKAGADPVENLNLADYQTGMEYTGN